MTTPFDYVKSVTERKDYMMDDPAEEKGYVPFLINRSLSFNVETLMHANEMNLNHWLDKKLQYDYYFHMLPKKKRYSKWFKKKEDANLELVRDYYKCSIQKAKEALQVLTQDQLDIIRKRFEQGGINK